MSEPERKKTNSLSVRFVFKPAFMSLDIRGRLVANENVVFASAGVQEEIEAAKILGRALASLRDGSHANNATTTNRP